MQLFKDFSLSAITAGFVAVLVGMASSIAIVFQAALSFGATPEMLASWLWVLAALAAYLFQFVDLIGPILQLIGGG